MSVVVVVLEVVVVIWLTALGVSWWRSRRFIRELEEYYRRMQDK